MRISDWSSDVCSSDLGYVPPRPDRTPTIAGFRFVTAQKVSRKNYDWVGLWVAEGNDQRTQIIGFNDTAHTVLRSEEHTSELKSLMRISYAVFCLKNKKHEYHNQTV